MNTYLISYDLKSESNRRKVIESITSLGEWCKCVSTTYVVQTSLSHGDVEKVVMQHLTPDDNMIICDIQGAVSGQLKTETRVQMLKLLPVSI